MAKTSSAFSVSTVPTETMSMVVVVDGTKVSATRVVSMTVMEDPSPDTVSTVKVPLLAALAAPEIVIWVPR